MRQEDVPKKKSGGSQVISDFSMRPCRQVTTSKWFSFLKHQHKQMYISQV